MLALLEALVPSSSSLGPARACVSMGFVGYTILIYDYFCTLETEIDNVWPCQMSIGLVLFYFNRYLPALDVFLFLRPMIVGSIPERECEVVFPATFWLVTAGLMMSQSILILRTYAIWGCRRLILYILGPITMILFSGMLFATSWKSFLDYKKMQSFTMDIPVSDDLKCKIAYLTIDDEARTALLILYTMVLSGEATIVVLTAIRASRDVDRFTPQWVHQLYKNGILYCVCMLCFSLTNICFIFAAPPSFKPVLLPMQRSFHSIFANRVMLLIFRHRKNNTSQNTGDHNRQRPMTFSASTMAVFTSVNAYNLESGGVDQITWQTRAQMEWIQ